MRTKFSVISGTKFKAKINFDKTFNPSVRNKMNNQPSSFWRPFGNLYASLAPHEKSLLTSVQPNKRTSSKKPQVSMTCLCFRQSNPAKRIVLTLLGLIQDFLISVFLILALNTTMCGRCVDHTYKVTFIYNSSCSVQMCTPLDDTAIYTTLL